MPEYFENEWYDSSSAEAARIILPFVVDRYKPASAIDIGCGQGGWLAELKKLGVTDVLGMDGSGITDKLISEDEFLDVDFCRDFPIMGRCWDIALCLEVGEHLPKEKADALVSYLSLLSHTIIFSAAIPGQAGHRHINCQWQGWWANKFRFCGFDPKDWLRNEIWPDSRIDSFYRQNIMALEYGPDKPFSPFRDVVHPDFYQYKRNTKGFS